MSVAHFVHVAPKRAFSTRKTMSPLPDTGAISAQYVPSLSVVPSTATSSVWDDTTGDVTFVHVTGGVVSAHAATTSTTATADIERRIPGITSPHYEAA